MAHSKLREIFQVYCRHLRDEFEIALGLVIHPGEKGVARERALVRHLRRLLPERYDIGSGFVVDAEGAISRQIDVIIYDHIVSPVFDVGGGLKYYPVECVVAVAEVKSTIKDRATMGSALENIASVKRLNRFAGRPRFEDSIHGAHGAIDAIVPEKSQLHPRYRIFGFIFTSESMSKESVIEELTSFCAANDRTIWPNMYVDISKDLISHISRPKEHGGEVVLSLYGEDSCGLYSTKEADSDNTVLLFTALLYRHLRWARVQEPDLLNYFFLQKTDADFHPFEDSKTPGGTAKEGT